MAGKLFYQELLSHRVKEHIVKEILVGKYKNLDRLPAEDTIAKELGVSRLTIRQALTNLAKEGLVIRKQGVGTIINPNVTSLLARLDYHMDCTQMLKNRNYEVEVVVKGISFVQASKKIADKLELPMGSQVCVISKIWYANGTPAIFIENAIPVNIFTDRDIIFEHQSESIIALIDKCTTGEYSYDVISLQCENIELLEQDVQNVFGLEDRSPFLILNQVAYDRENTPLYHAKEYYRSGFVEFSLVRNSL